MPRKLAASLGGLFSNSPEAAVSAPRAPTYVYSAVAVMGEIKDMAASGFSSFDFLRRQRVLSNKKRPLPDFRKKIDFEYVSGPTQSNAGA